MAVKISIKFTLLEWDIYCTRLYCHYCFPLPSFKKKIVEYAIKKIDSTCREIQT